MRVLHPVHSNSYLSQSCTPRRRVKKLGQLKKQKKKKSKWEQTNKAIDSPLIDINLEEAK